MVKELFGEINGTFKIGDTYHDINFSRITILAIDKDYGADADGGRGILAEFIDEDYAEAIMVDSKPLNSFQQSFQKEVRETIDEWSQKYPPIDNV